MTDGPAEQRLRAAFGDEQYRKLREARSAIARSLPLCDDAEACGVNVSAQRAALRAMDQQLAEIEARFFPDRMATEHV